MLYWIIATVAAFFVKGLCGFANTLVFTSILSFGVSNANISPVELLLGFPTNVILAWKERKSIRWGICLPLALLVVIGTIPGALFLKNADSGSIKIVFGVIIVLIGLEMLLRSRNTAGLKQSKVVGLVTYSMFRSYGMIFSLFVSIALGMLTYVILDTIRNRGFKNIFRSLMTGVVSVAGVGVFSL